MAVQQKRRVSQSAPASLADLTPAPAPAAAAKKAGLFDGLAKLFRGRLRPEAALYAVLASAMVADGRVAPEESEELTALCHRTKTLGKLKAEARERLHALIAPRLDHGKRADLAAHAAKSLPQNMRLSAFGHACDIIFADRLVLRSERDFLTKLIADLGLAEAEAEDMLRAIRAKNAH